MATIHKDKLEASMPLGISSISNQWDIAEGMILMVASALSRSF